MYAAVFIASVAALLAVLIRMWPSTRKKATRGRATSKPEQARSPYQSVSIVCDYSACDTARKMARQRFLVAEAPLLPLGDCDASACSCKYAHHQDRRSGQGDRRAALDLHTQVSGKGVVRDRRHAHARRRSDWKYI